jgi:uncharacterized protein
LSAINKAVEEGSSKAAVRLAQIYENREYNTKDVGKAQELYEKAIETDEEAMNYIGRQWYEKHQYDRAVTLFKRASNLGNATAMNNLGTWYELGKGVEKDILQAFDLYEEAAKKGNPQAMSNLGFLYYKEAKVKGSEEQYLEAAHWFRFSIAEDDKLQESHYYLGWMYLNGEGVDQSFSLAFECFEKAAENGHDVAWLKIGDLCYRGFNNIKSDKLKAYEWYVMGAKRGNSQCINNLGLMLENGFDQFDSNQEEAFKQYQIASEMGNTDAIFNLALAYQNGVGVEIDDMKAIDLLKKAANLGHQNSQNYLIRINENGLSTS